MDRRERRLGLAAIVVLSSMLTAVLATSLLLRPHRVLYGQPGDAYGTLHGFELVAGWLAGHDTLATIPFGQVQPLIDVPGALIARLAGPVAAYNLLVLSSFPLASLFGFLCASELTPRRDAAVLAREQNSTHATRVALSRIARARFG